MTLRAPAPEQVPLIGTLDERLGRLVDILSRHTAQISVLQQRTTAAAQVAAAVDPTPTSSTTYVMMGLNLRFTPTASTRGLFTLNGQIGNGTNNGQSFLQLAYGTGPSPANGATVSGTLLPGVVYFVATAGGGSWAPFSQSDLIEGLTPGVNYWIGAALRMAVAGPAFIKSPVLVGVELLDPVR